MGPVKLQRLTGRAVLRKKDFLVRPVLQPPLLHPSLKDPRMLLLDLAGQLFTEMLKEGLGFQFGCRLQHRLSSGPYPAERVGSRSPGMSDLKLGGGLAGTHIFSGCRADYVGH